MKFIFSALLFFSVGIGCSQNNSPENNSPHFFYGRTTGRLPFLEYGIGEDRLGGAKMTFLDSNILLKVIDSFKTKYIVQLSKNHTSFIDKPFIAKIDTFQPHLQNLSGNWRSFGDSAFDYVTISLDEKLPYKSIQQINPSRIIVDIFGVTTNTNWITQLKTSQEIKNVYYEQTEDDVMRVFIELKHPQHWGYTIFYENNKLIIRVKRQPAIPELKYLTIAVDAGHGGDNLGADGVSTKILEKNYTLLIAEELKALLINKNAKVIMTREKDTSLPMADRVEFLKQQQPDLLISIHLNSASSDTVRGVSTYYRYIGFRPLSVAILNNMLQLGLAEYGNVGNFNFGLSGPTDYPNCLVEVAFLSNRQDERLILQDKFRKQVAQKIVDGIEEFLKNL